MSGERSAWRANDVVANDVLREQANTAIALLLRLAVDGAIIADHAASEATDIRAELSTVDGYDRAAVDAARARLDKRIIELTDKQP